MVIITLCQIFLRQLLDHKVLMEFKVQQVKLFKVRKELMVCKVHWAHKVFKDLVVPMAVLDQQVFKV